MEPSETAETGTRRPTVTTRGSSRVGVALFLVILISLGLAADLPAQADHLPQGRWIWPTGGPVAVTRAFDPPSMPWLSGHRGVDLNAPVGSVLVAPANGTVVFSGTVVDRQVVSVMHEGGLRSTYEPVIPLVQTGAAVRAGAPIATVAPGHSPGPLHWGARFAKNEYVNPLRMIVGPSVLKPWE